MRKRIEENERESEIERDRVGYEKFIVESSKFGHDPSIFSVVSRSCHLWGRSAGKLYGYPMS